ncbi:MAG: TatD DNase family protein [Glaciecola sp.]|jgi:TatD DNase family protein
MIDSHCHIDLDAFDADREDVLQHAFQIGIERLLVLGLSNQQFPTLLKLKQRYHQLDIALGLHPYFLQKQDTEQTQHMLDELARLAALHSQQYIAFGEMGLDGSIALDMAYQKHILRYQLTLAQQYKKPIILHHRKSHNHLIAALKEHRYEGGGILHAFSGSYQEARTYIDMGFLLGVGGTITYPRAKKTRETISNLPLDRLVIETDSPDMPINGFQGQRNEPSQLTHVVDALSKLKNITKHEVVRQTTENYLRLFALPLN